MAERTLVNRKEKIWFFIEKLIALFLLLCGLVSIFVTAGVVIVLIFETIQFFKEVSLQQFLFDTQWTPLYDSKHFGVWPLVCGTFLTSFIAMCVALPFGLLSAIYLSEYASKRARQILKPLLEILAGIPTVVFGYFALVFVTPILQKWIPSLAGFNALSPGIVMGIMIIPTISSLGEDALFAVPKYLREAAFGLGARKLPVIFRIVIPAALSGIITAVSLAIARAVGETMVVSIAAGQRPSLTLDPRVPIETMTAYIVQVSMGDTPTGTIEHKTIFVVGMSLFVLTWLVNWVGQQIARRARVYSI